MSSPSAGETTHRVGASETNASPSSSPEKLDAYRSPSPRTRTEEASPTRMISPSWSPSTGRMVDSRRKSPAVPSSPLVNSEKQGLVACDDQRVPVAMIANEVNAGEPPVSLSAAKEALDGDDLRHKYVVLRRLQDQLVTRDGSLEEQDTGDLLPFVESMAAVCQALKLPGLGALRMVELVCSIASTLACLTRPGFTVPASIILPELLQFLRIPETGVRKSVSECVETILQECPATSTLHAATASLVDAKNPYLRRKGSRFLCFILEKWTEEALRVSRPLIMGQIRKAMIDSDANVRREGRGTFGAFVRLWPSEGVRMYNALDFASQRATLQEQPFVSNFVGGETFPSCEEGDQTESSSPSSKSWRPPGSVGSLPVGFGRTHPEGIRRGFSPTKGAVRSASRLPSLRSISKRSHYAGKLEDNLMGATEVTSSPSRSLSSEESGLESDHDEAGGCGMTPGELRRSMMGKYDEFPSPRLHDPQRNAKNSKSLPRCVDAHRAVDLPSRGLARTSSPRKFGGEPLEVATSLTPNRSPQSGVKPPRGTSRSSRRHVRFSPYKEESGLAKRSLTVRATAEKDDVTTVKVDGVQHLKKMPRMILVLLVTFTIAVVSGVFGFVFLSTGKLPGRASLVHREAVVVAGTTGVLYQKELEASVGLLRACAAIDLGAVTTKDGGDGTSTSGIGDEYSSTFSKDLATDFTSTAVTETSNKRALQTIHHLGEDSDKISYVTDPGESMSHIASDDSRLARDIDVISANPDRVNPGEFMSPASSDDERLVRDTDTTNCSPGLVDPGESPSRPASEDRHMVRDTDTTSLSPGLVDLGESLSGLALDSWLKDICLMVSAITFALVANWMASVKNRLLDDSTAINSSGVGGDKGVSTPPRKNATEETQQDEEELGCYNKMEVIKKVNSPATVRSVKRSRRIESAKKVPNSRRKTNDIG